MSTKQARQERLIADRKRRHESRRTREAAPSIDGISIPLLAERFTPQQAAKIKRNVYMIRCNTDLESLNYTDPITDNDGGHRWFVYCLDVVARQA